MSKADYQIPFDEKGNMMSYPESWRGLVWRDNTPFKAVLTFEGFERGRSSAIAIFKGSNGKRYPMFLKDLGDAITRLVAGKLEGIFQGQKRGTNYAIKWVGEAK